MVTSDAGLLAYREPDDALGLSPTAGDMLADARTGRNGRHALVGMLRQAVFARLAGYEDVNDAEKYAIRLPSNRVLQERIGYLLNRAVGRPSHYVRRSYPNFTYQAGSWTKPRRVISTASEVWVNTRSGKYWKPGSRYYGKTKEGEFMPELDALDRGYSPAGGTGQ